LYRGLLAVEELLPGIGAELRREGAVTFDTGELAWLGEFGWAPGPRKEFQVLSATRPLFEHLVLRRISTMPGVEVRDGTRVENIRRGSEGVPWLIELQDGSIEAADLVVDASGRASRLPVWLAAAGVSRARTSEVDARLGYATRVYALDARRVAAPGVVLLQTPQTRAGGLALPVEGGRWLVCAVGSGDRRPPRDPGGFDAYVDGLRDGALAELIGTGQPEGDVAVHRQTSNRRHHYEKVRNWPDGLLPIGDALCVFNPIYGQGITVAACESLLLQRALAHGFRRGEERRMVRRFAKVTALPWAIATGEDLRYPTTLGEAPWSNALLGRWTRELGRLAAHGDELAQGTVARVYHLMAPPWLLFRPALMTAALRARVRGYGPPTPRPQVLRGPALETTAG
jgi:2-polyprenyl-6-methoxyphenol hydroxylase-like FAD-dependent oxidoreductase